MFTRFFTSIAGPCLFATLWGGMTLMSAASSTDKPFPVSLKNPSFEEPMGKTAPAGWNRYNGTGDPQVMTLQKSPFGEGTVLLLRDEDANGEIGIYQDIPARGGVSYKVTAAVAAPKKAPAPTNVFLQMRFLPSNTYVQRSLFTASQNAFETLSLTGAMPKKDTTIRLYIYTHKGPATAVLVDALTLTGGVPPVATPVTAPTMKAPRITKLKDLHLTTPLVTHRQPRAVIVIPPNDRYGPAARTIQAAIRRVASCTVPIVPDTSADAVLPPGKNLIVLGNRSTHRTINALYDAYYTLLDLKYPGPDGAVLRSLHNPYANGRNIILVGGSDDNGVARAAQRLAKHIESAPAGADLAVGHLMDIHLGKGVSVPKNLRDFETWEASENYGSVGYFGWNSLSKRMAMYYMTGDEFQAREFLRLAFPDKQALKEISDIDGERIENKDDPLAGAYHYNQHMMILYWDLIEESPVFTDEQRLRITNALGRQLEHPDYARKGVYALRQPAGAVSSRHGQWAAIGLYCLGRYFNKYYPDPVWKHCQQAGEFAFQSLHKHAWVNGENDNLFWYSTGIAPIFTYLCLSGDRVPVKNGVIGELLRGQEILLSGLPGDRQISSASLGFLNKAAYITGSGRWITYRQRLRLKTDIFRLGQSYWPGPECKPEPPTDLCNKWSIQALPLPMWLQRNSGIPLEQSFQFGSFRTATDAGGDFVLLDGYNGASRNPYHTFDILNLRIAGTTLLQGYQNQVLTKADGMVEARVAMNAALLYRDCIGQTATACGQVPDAAFCNWRRTLVQRLGRYALIVDDLTFRSDSANMAVNTVWQPRSGTWLPEANYAVIKGKVGMIAPPGWISLDAMNAACTSVPDKPGMIVRLNSLGIVLLRAREPGAHLDVPFHLDAPFSGEAFLDTIRYVDRGVVRVLVDGKAIGDRLDLHAGTVDRVRLPLGRLRLDAGDHKLRLQVVDRAGTSSKCYAALAGLLLKPDHIATPKTANPVFKLATSDPVDVSGSGVITMRWTGTVTAGMHGMFFHLLAPGPDTQRGSTVLRLAPNAAFLQLPEAAVAGVGTYRNLHADIAILAATHAYGRGLTRLGLDEPLLTSDQPIAMDWSFGDGTLVVRAEKEARLTFAGLGTSGLRLDGKSCPPGATIIVPAGKHTLTGVLPGKPTLTRLAGELDRIRVPAVAAWKKAAVARRVAAGIPKLPKLSVQPVADLGHAVTDLRLLRWGKTPLLAAAEEKKVHLLTPGGKTERVLETAGVIRVLHWWPEADSLLVACADEKLLAFGRDGKRKWEFTSVMDPAVFRAAKTYWFKSAPGHEGIHGVATGPFIGGKSQCIIGSACTAEILNTDGSLAKRMAVFWGPGKLIRIVPAANGTHDALIARWPNGTDQLSIINSKALTVRRGFYGVPAGQTMVGGWSAQNRVDIIWHDVNGDGEPELVSATNGRWNRVTVFSRTGHPLFNAQFGPGPDARFRAYLRDLKIADPDGDGKYTIYTATHDKLVVALDHECRRLWSVRLPSAPCRLLPCGQGNRFLLVGCDDGTLVLLKADSGDFVAVGAGQGRPSHVLSLPDGRVAVATEAGAISIVSLP